VNRRPKSKAVFETVLLFCMTERRSPKDPIPCDQVVRFIPIPDRFESNPTLANGVWIVATMPSPIQGDLEAVLELIF
jgi:hypothetical protein